MIFKIFGVIGMLLKIWGILSPADEDQKRNILFALGGLFLLVYSLYLKDPIFIPLQIIFIASSIYDFYIIKKQMSKEVKV